VTARIADALLAAMTWAAIGYVVCVIVFGAI
jgi:hypothetical protein